MSKWKWCLICIAPPALPGSAVLLASFALSKFLRQPLDWLLWWHALQWGWWGANWWVSLNMLIATLLGLMWIFFWLALAWRTRRKLVPSLYGASQWATDREITQNGLTLTRKI